MIYDDLPEPVRHARDDSAVEPLPDFMVAKRESLCVDCWPAGCFCWL
jgi:hypothetical protein